MNSVLALVALTAIIAGSSSVQAGDKAAEHEKDFVWYCESDEATEAQKTTVREILLESEIDPENTTCKDAFKKLTSENELYLFLDVEPLSDLRPLTGLTNLIALYCDVCSFAAIDSIPDLPKLGTLRISGEEFTKLPDLNRFRKLKRLFVSGPLREVETDRIKNITFLFLSRPELDNLDFLLDLPSLKEAHFEGLKTSATENLPEIPSIQKASFISLEGKKSDFRFLKKFPNLVSLDLEDNYLTGIDNIYLPPNLKELMLNENQIAEIPIGYLPHELVKLTLDENPIKKYGFLAELKNLRSLSIVHNHISDWEELSPLQPTIENLELQYTNLKERPRTPGEKQSWPKLAYLSLDFTEIKSLAFLKDFDMPALTIFIPPNIEVKTEENCPTSGVADQVAAFCEMK